MRTSTRLPRTLSALFVALLSVPLFAQTTWYVDANAPPPGLGTVASPYSDLQFALAQATTVSGDTVLVLPGTYTGGFDFLGKDVVVQSTAGAATTILDGGAVWPPPSPGLPDPSPTLSVVTFKSGEGPGATLDGFTVQHGTGTATPAAPFERRGAGIYVSGASPTLTNLLVRENRGDVGMGMYFESSSSTVSQCTLRNNGGRCYCSGFRGLGIYSASSITVDQCEILDNNGNVLWPGLEGGGIWASAGTFTHCRIAGNHAMFGAGAWLSGTATLEDCVLENNLAGSVDADPGKGGGAYGGTLTRCILQNNHGGHAGGGAFQSNLVDCILRGNSVARPLPSTFFPIGGGGAWGGTLLRCDVYANRAGDVGPLVGQRTGSDGGGIAGATATSCRIHDNVVYADGGAFAHFIGYGGAGAAFSTLVDCDVFDNDLLPTAQSPVPAICGGGGLYAGTATRCRIWGNSAPNAAGAANATLVNCTVADNAASVDGGGVGSVYTAAASMVVRNGILWGNLPNETTAPFGTLTIDWSDVQGGFVGVGNILSDPLFQSAANHDYHLLAGSPCIDAGDPLVLDPDGSRVDMGAFPFECGVHNYCVGKVNSLGCVPSAAFTGTPDLSGADDFHVTGTNIRKNATGLLLWSRGGDAAPFHNGTLCVASTIFRTPTQNAGGTGVGPNCTGSFDFFFSHAYMNARGILPFQTIFAQWYMRDAAHPDGTGVGLSDGVAFTVCP